MGIIMKFFAMAIFLIAIMGFLLVFFRLKNEKEIGTTTGLISIFSLLAMFVSSVILSFYFPSSSLFKKERNYWVQKIFYYDSGKKAIGQFAIYPRKSFGEYAFFPENCSPPENIVLPTRLYITKNNGCVWLENKNE